VQRGLVISKIFKPSFARGLFTFISEQKRKFVYASLMHRNLYTGVEDAIMTFKFSGITSNGTNKRNKMTKIKKKPYPGMDFRNQPKSLRKVAQN
jgi:hypothetical protein